MSQETDTDLMMSYEIVKLPSKGLFYKNKISEVNVEYMTSKDEDLLTTPSLIENGTVLDVLLKRKMKTKDIHGKYYGKLTRQERRAMTPQGFAQAFFEANR